MDIQVAALCSAATDSGGALNILGALNIINAPQAPVVCPQCSIVLRIMFNKIEEGPHKLKLNFVDEDGRPVMRSMEMPLEVRVPDDSTFAFINVIVSIQQLKFEKPGQHSIDIAFDGRMERSIPLVVRILPPNPVPGQPGQGFPGPRP